MFLIALNHLKYHLFSKKISLICVCITAVLLIFSKHIYISVDASTIMTFTFIIELSLDALIPQADRADFIAVRSERERRNLFSYSSFIVDCSLIISSATVAFIMGFSSIITGVYIFYLFQIFSSIKMCISQKKVSYSLNIAAFVLCSVCMVMFIVILFLYDPSISASDNKYIASITICLLFIIFVSSLVKWYYLLKSDYTCFSKGTGKALF